MRGILFLISILGLLWTNNAFCSSLQSQASLIRYEINKLDKAKNTEEAELLKPMIEANINYLSGAIRLKIKKSEDSLDKIKEQIQECNSNEEWSKKLSEKRWKKFYSTQKKIESLNDLLFTIEHWKLKLVE